MRTASWAVLAMAAEGCATGHTAPPAAALATAPPPESSIVVSAPPPDPRVELMARASGPPPAWWCSEGREVLLCRRLTSLSGGDKIEIQDDLNDDISRRMAARARRAGVAVFGVKEEMPETESYGPYTYFVRVYRLDPEPGPYAPSRMSTDAVLTKYGPPDAGDRERDARDYLDAARTLEQMGQSVTATDGWKSPPAIGPGGPVCSTGCPCGNACISCGDVCHIGSGGAHSGYSSRKRR